MSPLYDYTGEKMHDDAEERTMMSQESPPPSARTLLERARAVIEKPENWCQGFYAVRTPRRESSPRIGVEVHSGDACAWCALGALHRAGRLAGLKTTSEPWSKAEDTLYLTTDAVTKGATSDVTEFNDWSETTHEAILALYDRAIAEVGA